MISKNNTDLKNQILIKIKILTKNIWKMKTFYLMLLPAIVLLFIFNYIPMYGVTLAFKDYSFKEGIIGSSWIGFEHFETIFSYDAFWSAFKNTLTINALKLLFGFPAPIALAIMLNSVANKTTKKFIQTIVYLPHFVSWVVISGLVFSLLDPKTGILTHIISTITGNEIDILSNPNAFRFLLVITHIWKGVGWSAIIYLAALTNISGEYYEAARIDGANIFQQFRYITIKLLMPTITLMLVLDLGKILSGGFDQVYNLYNETVYKTADILDTYIYRMGVSNGFFSIGTAIGLFANVINIIFLLISNKAVKLMGGEGLY